MTDNPWPDDPSRRKIVLVLNQDDIIALDYDSEYDGDVLLNNEEVHILSSHPPEPGPAVQALIDQGVVTSSAVLIQNPFDKSLYYRESEALEEIALAKRLHFSTLCGHLGAREVKVEQIRLKKEEHETTFSVEGGIPVAGSGKLDGKMEALYSFAHRLSVTHEFDGSEPNVQTATEFLQQTGLSNETIMQDMLNKAQISNKLKSAKIGLNLITEGHQNLKVLANLNLEATKLPISLESNYDRKEYERTEYTLTVAVKF